PSYVLHNGRLWADSSTIGISNLWGCIGRLQTPATKETNPLSALLLYRCVSASRRPIEMVQAARDKSDPVPPQDSLEVMLPVLIFPGSISFREPHVLHRRIFMTLTASIAAKQLTTASPQELKTITTFPDTSGSTHARAGRKDRCGSPRFTSSCSQLP